MTVITTKQKWQAERYNKLSIIQNTAFKNFSNHLNLNGNETILDLGCGDGEITSKIAKLIPRGEITGLDISPEMIEFAQNHYQKCNIKNIHFFNQDMSSISSNEEFDMVFSSYAFQWIPDKNYQLKKIHTAIKNKGTLALILPTQVSVELDFVISSITSSPQWSCFFDDFHPGWHFVHPKQLKQLVAENLFDVTHFTESILDIEFDSKDALKEYILLWFPYLRPLPDHLKNIFFLLVMDAYFDLVPPASNGKVRLKIPQVEIIASKKTYS